ncbi:uncharacterized protein LOC130668211 isoform X1 [Microplitis mediator]|uniref:uncharacterized protein LOC130668211 isoform X1 n=1 Tax=Microplitis mediator TaxID=375433 RepID=UPI00255340E2|nr:uncharacterized protein LOC130668211 isoform X1 [Microplitis mediator]XP_057326361.1 uncharacterized protein LOC130668211 isoform X1 [Microplitis mediator]
MEHFIIMSHQQELKDVTTVITSILTAKKPPRGIPLVNLDQDYYEFESQRIPYRRLGFSSLVDFIKTIPEVEIYERGTSHFINFLGKNSTRHISDLVAKQRNPSFKNRSRSVNTRKTAPAMYRPRDSSSSSSSIDPKVTSYISSIIYNHPYGMKESELIQKLLHKRPYLTLSSYQCKEHLRILDREVVIRDDLIYPKNSSSIPRESSSFAARPSRSQSVAPKRHFNNNNNNNGHSNGEYYDRRSEETNGNYWGRSYDNHRYAEHNYSNTNGNYALNYQDNYGNAGNDRRENQSHQSSVLSNNFKVAGIDSDEHYEADDLGFDEETEYAGASAPAANGIQGYGDSNGYNYDYEVQDMQNGDSRHNGGNIVEQVPSYGNLDKFEDKKKVNFEADHRQLEFIGADDGAGAGDVAAAGDVAGAVVEVDRKEALFKKNKEYIAQTISKRTVLRLEKLLENNPNGIWCIDLPKLYTEDYKLTLEWEDFGFQRLSDFVSHLPKIFKMVGPYRNGDYRLFDARKPLPDDEFQRQQKPTMASLYNIYGDNDNDDALPKTISLETKQALCPDNVLGINETVGHISVTRFEPDIDANGEPSMKNIEVNVVEAFTPSFFWVQLARNKPKFEQMMEDLGNFYDENSLRYRIPPIVIERGLNIACQFFGKWHRGIIKSITPTGSRVTVMFYDFGTIKSYRPEEVYFLHRRFGVMDAQAIPCGLCYIQPRKRNSGSHDGQSNEWPKDARDQFLHMAFKCEMWATIVKVDVDNNSMQIGLTDTSGDEDLHIADYLIHKKFAEKSNTVRITTRNFHYIHSKRSSIAWKQKYLSSLANSRLTKMNHLKSSNKFLPANQKANQSPLQNSNQDTQRHGEALSPSMLREIAKSKVKNSKPVELPPPPIVLNYAPTPTIHLLPLGSSHDKVNLWFELNNELNNDSDAGGSAKSGDHSFEASRLKKVTKSDNNFTESKLQRVPKAFKLEDIFKMSEHRITSEPHRDPETSKAQYISGSSKNLSLPKVSSSEDHKSVGSKRLSNLINVLDKNEKIPVSRTFSSPLTRHRQEEPDWKNRHLNKNDDYSASSKSLTSSDESSNKNRPSTLSNQGVSQLLTAFGGDDDDKDDQVPESGTFGSPLGGHGREEPIDWNAVRQMVNKDDVKVQAKSEPVKEKILPATANRKSQPAINKSYLNDKAHNYFDNFYESCVASKFTNGNPILSWESEDEIKYTGVITPMVRQTLNTINKNSDSVKVTVPVNLRRLIEKSSNSSSEETSSDSKTSGWNSPSERRISQPIKMNDVIDNKSDSDSLSSESTKQLTTIHKLLKARHLNKINKTCEDDKPKDDNDNSKEINDTSVECQPEEKKKVLIEELPSPKSSPKSSRIDQKKNVNSIYYASARISLCKKINRLQDAESSDSDDVDLDSDDSSFYEKDDGEKKTSVNDNDDSEEIDDKNDRDEEKLNGKLDSEEIDDKNYQVDENIDEEKLNGKLDFEEIDDKNYQVDENIDEEKLDGKLDSEKNSTDDKNDVDLDKNDTDNDNQNVDEGMDPSAGNELQICTSAPIPRFNDVDVDSDDSDLGIHLPLDFLAHFFGVQLPPQAGIANSSADTETDIDSRSEDEGVKIDEINCDDEKPHSSSSTESSLDISSARGANQSVSSQVETDSESPQIDPRAGIKKQFAKVSNQLEPKKKFESKKDDEETTVRSTVESDFRDTDEEKIKKTQGYKLKCSLVNEVKKSGLLESPKFVKNCELKFNADEFLDID